MSEKYSSGTTPEPSDTERQLLVKILTSLNNSSGGTGGAPTSISYAGPPTSNPPALANIVVDSAGRIWTYYESAWH